MTRRVVFHQLAERELNEAAAYYHEARPGLGAVFLEAVERTVLRAAAALAVANTKRRPFYWRSRR